ncbi:hypothetical protein [Streptomyces sp. NPDC042319]
MDQGVVEHGTVPNGDVYFALKDGSANLGEVNLDAFATVAPHRPVRVSER